MRIPIAERALSLTLVALALAPSACRDDTPQPPVENPATGGTGGRSSTGGRGGSSSTGGSGGAKIDAAAGGSAGVDAAGDAAGPVDVDESGDAIVVNDGWSGADLPTIEVGDGGVLTVMRPFYGHPPYPAGVIRPTGAQATLDMAAATFYTKWKKDYVVSACGGAYVQAPASEATAPATIATVSQIHGAGMIATVIFAGHDLVAKTTYDNMFKFARAHKSTVSPALMAHAVNRTGATCPSVNGDTETDGDLNIAMSLLMADKQWGSAGEINYLDEAKKTIAAIKASEMNPTTMLPYVADYAPTDTNVALATKVRSSDLLVGHFTAFATATGDAFWTAAVTSAYTLIGKIQAGPSATSGLLPDFLANTATATPTPSTTASEAIYDYTTAGYPVMLAADYIANSGRTPNAKPVLDKINGWIKTKTGSNPAMVVDGYQLNGTAKAGASESPLFEAGFGAAAVVDAANQAWLDAIWMRAISPDRTVKDSFTETPQLMALVVMSGNYWAP